MAKAQNPELMGRLQKEVRSFADQFPVGMSPTKSNKWYQVEWKNKQNPTKDPTSPARVVRGTGEIWRHRPYVHFYRLLRLTC